MSEWSNSMILVLREKKLNSKIPPLSFSLFRQMRINFCYFSRQQLIIITGAWFLLWLKSLRNEQCKETKESHKRIAYMSNVTFCSNGTTCRKSSEWVMPSFSLKLSPKCPNVFAISQQMPLVNKQPHLPAPPFAI